MEAKPKKRKTGHKMSVDMIVLNIAADFPTFGGGRKCAGNPIAEALKDRGPMFALGVDVRQVVERVLQLAAL
jgi:hypothetical protein